MLLIIQVLTIFPIKKNPSKDEVISKKRVAIVKWLPEHPLEFLNFALPGLANHLQPAIHEVPKPVITQTSLQEQPNCFMLSTIPESPKETKLM